MTGDISASTFRVMTWNVRGSSRPDRDALALAIRSFDPDVVAIQEIMVGQAHRLANRLGWQVSWARKHFPLGPLVWWRAEGLAVMSKHRVVHRQTWLLSHEEGISTYRRRVAQRVDVVNGEHVVHLVNTHLASHAAGLAEHRSGRSPRAAEAHVLAEHLYTEHLDESADSRRLVVGDLNARDEPEVLAPLLGVGLRDAWPTAVSISGGDGSTAPAQRPIERIDYVLVGSGWRVTHVEVPTPGPAWSAISDHLPVIADLVRI